MIKNVRILNSTPYQDMKEAALRTMGLKRKSSDTFNPDWIRKSLISRHSHIRCVFLRIDFETEKSIRDQILRSKHGYVEPYVCSQRPDRTGVPRSEHKTSSWYHDFNLEGLLKMCGDRLCSCTEINTRNEVSQLKTFMMTHEDHFLNVVGSVLSPKCAWYSSCNEFDRRNCFDFSNYGDSITNNIDQFNEEYFYQIGDSDLIYGI